MKPPASSAQATASLPTEVAGVGRVFAGADDASRVRVGLCASRFHAALVDRLVAGAVRALGDAGLTPADIDLAWAPGAFELPILAQALIASGRYDAIVALGVVVRGETPHFEYVAGECARGLAEVARASGRPVLFGVVTADTMAQAEARCGGSDNKGAEAALAAIQTARVLKEAR